MKKTFILLLTACILICLSACDARNTHGKGTFSTSSQSMNEGYLENSDTNLSRPTLNDTSKIESHVHKFSAADCESQSAAKCSCGISKGSALGHDCYDATCTLPKKCKRCGITKGSALGHDYSFATCTEPKKCNRCGIVEGKALGHSCFVGQCSRCSEFFAPEINLPALPLTLNFSHESQILITEMEYEIDAKGSLIIMFSGEKIAGMDDHIEFNYKLTDADGFASVAGKWSEQGYHIGDKFEHKELIINNIGASRKYRVVIFGTNQVESTP